ncbi:MAG TPA: hypothetical protein VLX30_11390 [Burkholderiales bacterium]|nr:hypothetical protein [Burkholderiales bacterium]
MREDGSNPVTNALQALAIVCLVLMLSVILHKGDTDVSLIAERHSGREFWLALARHIMLNLSGG